MIVLIRCLTRSALFALLGVVIVRDAFALGSYSFQGLGGVNGNPAGSLASDVSADGSVVVGAAASNIGDQEAFRWTSGAGMLALGDLPGPFTLSNAAAVSANGNVFVGVGYPTGAPGLRATRWNGGPGPIELTGGYITTATGVSADGSLIVGGDAGPSPLGAVTWDSLGVIHPLGALAGGAVGQGQANGVSANGTIVVGYDDTDNGWEAFRWVQGSGMTGLGELAGGASQSIALDVSRDGGTIVGNSQSANGEEAFRWTQSLGMAPLGDLPGGTFASSAHAVSDGGYHIVGRARGAGGQEAFLWNPVDGMRSLRQVLVTAGINMTGWTLTSANGISSDGRVIVGEGINSQGLLEAWRATIVVVPEPGGAAVAVAALGTLAVTRRRWRLAE
jgi:probable HAF family extracellular repeat protein